MWKDAEDVPDALANEILERYDQTEPGLRRLITLQFALNAINAQAELARPGGNRRQVGEITRQTAMLAVWAIGDESVAAEAAAIDDPVMCVQKTLSLMRYVAIRISAGLLDRPINQGPTAAEDQGWTPDTVPATVREALLLVAAWATETAAVCYRAIAGITPPRVPLNPHAMLKARMEETMEQKGEGSFYNAHEMLGVISEEIVEMAEAACEQPTPLFIVAEECLDVAVACAFGVACIDARGLTECDENHPDPDAEE